MSIRLKGFQDEIPRRVVSVALGCQVCGGALCTADTGYTLNLLDGAEARIAAETPKLNVKLLAKWRRYCAKWNRKNLVPLPADTDLSIGPWLESTNYSRKRCDMFERVYADTFNDGTRYNFTERRGITPFIKYESAIKPKHPRVICDRNIPTKIDMGAVCKAIERVLYAHPSFIKHVPVGERAQYIKEFIGESCDYYIAADYDRYESHFVAEILQSAEFQLYKHMLRNIPGFTPKAFELESLMAGQNRLATRFIVILIWCVRMSGDQNTSLGNGYTNKMAMEFILTMNKNRHFKGVIEGDDSAYGIRGRPPTAAMFLDLGFSIKLEVFRRIGDMSFCGLVFDPDAMQSMTEPRKVFLGFGWADGKYVDAKPDKLLGLLRCKAMSLACEHPGCPLITALAKYALRVTKGARMIFPTDRWHANTMRQWIQNGIKHQEILYETRMLFEDRYGIHIEDQYRIENYLDNLKTLQPLAGPVLMLNQSDTRDMCRDYVMRNDTEFQRYPIIRPQKITACKHNAHVKRLRNRKLLRWHCEFNAKQPRHQRPCADNEIVEE